MPSTPAPEPVIPASVSHFIIFNPTLQRPPPISTTPEHEQSGSKAQQPERNGDLEDDLKEASQILFYTSREGGKVSRDKMLRQYGLVKGLMGFTDMVLEKPAGTPKEGVTGWWGVHSQKSRMVIWTPEEGVFMYINVTLPNRASGEAVHSAQGISDQMIVDGLRRGYEDYRLLHGPLSALYHSSSATSANLERYWTRFAFQFESTHLSPSDPGQILFSWMGGYPTPSADRASKANLAIDQLSEHVHAGSLMGLITRDGPLYTSSPLPPALSRYLVHALPTLAPVATITSSSSADRSTLGLGFGMGFRKKPKAPSTISASGQGERQSSWTSWVPTLGSGADTPKEEVSRKSTEETTSRWPSFGLSGLGMGTVFGTGSRSSGSVDHIPGPRDGDPASAIITAEPNLAGRGEDSASIASSHLVEQSDVVIHDLEAAVDDDAEIELVWEKKDIWLEASENGVFAKRRLMWLIRDDKLLYIVFPSGTTPPFEVPLTSATLAVFASLPDPPIRASTDSSRPTTHVQSQNTYIHHRDNITDTQAGIDPSSSITLAELRDRLHADTSIHEIYAKSSNGRFLVAAKAGEDEMYMQIGRKDASLTDAEQAVKSFRPPHGVVA